MLNQDFLQFFIELAPNNNKAWFDENRKRYETNVKKPFHALVEELLQRLKASVHPEIDTNPSKAIFRINRDIRFSKDKSPYKLQMSAHLSPHGRKEMNYPALYFEAGPEKLAIYSGLYMPDKQVIEKVRDKIATQSSTFKALYTEKAFVDVFGEIQGEKSKIIPKNLKEAAAEEALIYNKSWYWMCEFPPETLLQNNVADLILDSYKACIKLNTFLSVD